MALEKTQYCPCNSICDSPRKRHLDSHGAGLPQADTYNKSDHLVPAAATTLASAKNAQLDYLLPACGSRLPNKVSAFVSSSDLGAVENMDATSAKDAFSTSHHLTLQLQCRGVKLNSNGWCVFALGNHMRTHTRSPSSYTQLFTVFRKNTRNITQRVRHVV